MSAAIHAGLPSRRTRPGAWRRAGLAASAVVAATVLLFGTDEDAAFQQSLRHKRGLSQFGGVDRARGAVARRVVYNPVKELPPVGTINEEEWIEVWDQSTEELALDVRELMVTDANINFIGPDVESYRDSIQEVCQLLNYTYALFEHRNMSAAAEYTHVLEHIYEVPPLLSVKRWPWSVLRQGLIVWIDSDGIKRQDVYQRDSIYKKKNPLQEPAYGPVRPQSAVLKQEDLPPADPMDMWQEADVQVNLMEHQDISVTNRILANIIEAILASPAKWRGWFKDAKLRQTISADYATPLEVRRSLHSNGVSPRLNRLLSA